MALVVITGFMGTGKTEVGRALAALLGHPFVDTDALVEQYTGSSIAELFEAKGESYFRAQERFAVRNALEVVDAVIATGGGTMMDSENCERLSAAGPIVALVAEPDVVTDRVSRAPNTRPLLSGKSSSEQVRSLQETRNDTYRRVATVTIDTTHENVHSVAAKIAKFLAERKLAERSCVGGI